MSKKQKPQVALLRAQKDKADSFSRETGENQGQMSLIEFAANYPCGWRNDWSRMDAEIFLKLDSETYFRIMLAVFDAGGNQAYNLATLYLHELAQERGWKGRIPTCFTALKTKGVQE